MPSLILPSHTIAFGKACTYYGFQKHQLAQLGSQCRSGTRGAARLGVQHLPASTSGASASGLTAAHGTCHEKRRSVSPTQSSLVNLVTSSHTPIPPPQHPPSCRLLPRRVGKGGCSASQVVTVAPHQLLRKCEQGLTLTSLSGCSHGV